MKQNYLIGIGFKLLNCLLFSTITLVIIHCASFMPVSQVLFARVSLGTIICIIYLSFIRQKIALKMPIKDFLFYLARATISFIAMQLWVFAIQYIGINEATALSYTGPFWVFLAARYLVGEVFNWKSLAAICVNMVGVLIILHPGLENLSLVGVGASVGSILLWVLYETICKKQTSTQHYMLQTFYVCAIASVIIAPFAFQEWQPVDLKMGGILLLLAALGVLNITSIFIAYYFAPMMLLSPFSYARLVFTVILSSWLYNTMPHIEVFIGSAIILIANCSFTYYSSIAKVK